MTATERKPPGLGHRARYMSPDRTSERIAALRPTAVNMIMAEVRALPDLPRQPVSLMRGEPDLPTPPHIVAAATTALRGGRTGYPNNQGEPTLRQAVARALERENGLGYRWQDEVLITSGATFGIYAALAERSKAEILAEFGGRQFSEFKPAMAELAVEKLAPVSGEMRRLLAAPDHIDAVLKDGGERAGAIAATTMNDVKDIIGLLRD